MFLKVIPFFLIMLYLIGLGLDRNGISKEGQLILSKCHKVYLEGYTVDFPYNESELHLGKKKVGILERKDVESNKLIKEALSKKIALLVYGSPLFATTHMSLLLDAKEQGVRTRVIHSASILDAIADTGLQLYKFGKIASMPDFSDKGASSSFMDIVKDNQSIKAHSLILADIGLEFHNALKQLEDVAKEKKIELGKIIVCNRLGTEDAIVFYNTIDKLRKLREVYPPFCIIIPGEMHFMEKQGLESVTEKNTGRE